MTSHLPFAFQNIQAVLFDLDGTLVDSAPDLAGAVDQMRTERGLPSFPLSHYRHMVGAGARGMLGVAFGMQPDHPDFAAMREEFFLNYERRLTRETYAFDGVAEVISALVARRLTWGVVTNKSERFALPLTGCMPIFATASVVIGGDTTSFAKPHPEPLLEAARRIGVLPENCLYVGDDVRDVVAGLAAGMGTVAAGYGYLGQDVDTVMWGAHAVIQTPGELLRLLA